jgi:hypothetical protein
MSEHPEIMPTPAPTGALAGLKVLDFTQSLAALSARSNWLIWARKW